MGYDIKGTGAIEVIINDKGANITLIAAISIRYGVIGF